MQVYGAMERQLGGRYLYFPLMRQDFFFVEISLFYSVYTSFNYPSWRIGDMYLFVVPPNSCRYVISEESASKGRIYNKISKVVLYP